VYIVVGGAVGHALLECAVHSGYGEGGVEGIEDFFVAIGIAQKCHFGGGGGVVVERQSAAVGYAYLAGVDTQFAGKFLYVG
jgi:hypothetical protein